MALGTDCTSLHDVCHKTDRLPEERRVALGWLDVRESLEHVGDAIRWIPTDHLRVGRLTKHMPTHLLTSYLRAMTYALTSEHQNTDAKRALQTTHKSLS